MMRLASEKPTPFYGRIEWICVVTLGVALLAVSGVRIADIKPILGAPAQASVSTENVNDP